MIAIWTYAHENLGFARHAHGLAEPLSLQEEVALIDVRTRRIFARWRGAEFNRCDEPLGRAVSCPAIGATDIADLHKIEGTYRAGLATWQTTPLVNRRFWELPSAS